jgi:ribosome-associated heat shock protein Hsp15
MRIDKWLWTARFYKTRTLAAHAVETGQVRVNGERIKPAHAVGPGSRVEVRKQGLAWIVEVTGVAERRGSATDAAALYRETEESAATRARLIAERAAASGQAVSGPSHQEGPAQARGLPQRAVSVAIVQLRDSRRSRCLGRLDRPNRVRRSAGCPWSAAPCRRSAWRWSTARCARRDSARAECPMAAAGRPAGSCPLAEVAAVEVAVRIAVEGIHAAVAAIAPSAAATRESGTGYCEREREAQQADAALRRMRHASLHARTRRTLGGARR